MLLMPNIFDLPVNEIFFIESGVVIKPKKENKGELYKLITPASIPKQDFHPISQELQEVSIPEVNPNKLLLKTDYLISARQLIKGYSLKHAPNIIGKNVIVSEHFFILRLRPTWEALLGVETYFFHNLLDLLVVKLIEHAISKTVDGKPQKFITLKEISEARIQFNIVENDQYLKSIDLSYQKIRKTIIEELKYIKDLKKLNEELGLKKGVNIFLDIPVEPKKNIRLNALNNTKSINLKTMIQFFINIGQAYYNQQFFNISVNYQEYFGAHNDELQVYLGTWDSVPLTAYINRLANPNLTPRIIFQGRNYNDFVQQNHVIGEALSVTLDPAYPNSILIQ